MNIGPKGIALIKSYERCRLHAYMPTPDDVPTIGWGATRGVAMGDVWTQDQADARFLEDVAWVEDCVNRAVTAQLLQEEFDSACSLCFNIGCRAFSGSTFVKCLNEGDFDAAADAMLLWNKQKGKELAGLTNRRQSEKTLFESANA